ncbi:MAG: cysteine--tRNA ligase [Cocleimonas sp.]|nr:cysteine--tRNA ligase [Cocleimonas sp.]
MLEIYNTLTNQKEEFKPIEKNKIRMYVCGMTVYDYCHLGHARVMIAFDVIYRYLLDKGFEVTYARNITDIDDKIIQRAIENKEDFNALTKRFIDAMHEDEESLGLLKPSVEPRATKNIPAILTMIQTLIDKGYAYQGKRGDVYYDVSKFEGYGKLSGRKLEDLREGAGDRINVDDAKDDPLDFVLWKPAKKGEPVWDSPWGEGRPGWHIECSAMSTALFGASFDIHGGGRDLQFPHHENEIAQSEACTGQHFANYWMHNGFIRINEEKMSKSLDNFFTIRDILKKYRGEEVRYFMLTSQYRSPLNYSEDQLEQSGKALARLYATLRELPEAEPIEKTTFSFRFHAAMHDDFNTPDALAALFDLSRETNKLHQQQDANAAASHGALLKQLGGLLGILQADPNAWLQGDASDDVLSSEAIETLIQKRLTAKADKDWAEADKIRDGLKQQGVSLEDKGTETVWRRD